VAQDKLATLSTNSRHDVVADATHASLVLDETMPPQPARQFAMSSRPCGPPNRSPSPEVGVKGLDRAADAMRLRDYRSYRGARFTRVAAQFNLQIHRLR
jgi:hypothetical protein